MLETNIENSKGQQEIVGPPPRGDRNQFGALAHERAPYTSWHAHRPANCPGPATATATATENAPQESG